MYGKMRSALRGSFAISSLHHGDRSRDAVLVGVVEREAHAEDDSCR